MNRSLRFGRTTVRPTAFGLTMLALGVAVFVGSGSTNDAVMAGFIWSSLVVVTALGWVWPVVALRLLRLRIDEAPADSTVGRPERLTVVFRGALPLPVVSARVDQVDLPGPLTAADRGGGAVPMVPRRRGIYDRLTGALETDGPLGMLRVSRSFDVPLPRPMAVGPDPVDQSWSPGELPESGPKDSPRPVHGGGDEVRSVRPYRSGDPAHLVHWPSSARAGTLVVREMEPPVRQGVVIVVEVPTAPDDDTAPETGPGATAVNDAVEASIGRAAGLARAVLRNGGGVVLCTNEAGRGRSAEVANERQINRRLAAAGPGTVTLPTFGASGAGAAGWPVVRFGAVHAGTVE